MGLRSVTIGYGYPQVMEAALLEMEKGNSMPRASHTELDAAEVITDLIPCADMVKFAKNGSTVTTAAVKLARAYTKREYVAICSEHPFFSYDDWFIGSTVIQKGIPDTSKELTLKFKYNDLESVKALFKNYPGQIAAVILEPATSTPPTANFLRELKTICKEHQTVLIFDEMITGFRWHLQGAQKYYDVEPDLATFGKGMANGFSVAALVGKRELMDLGGILEQGQERVFLISSTHGAEMSGLGAFIKTVELYKELDVVGHMWEYGKKLIDGMNAIAKDYGIQDYFYLGGYPCSPVYIAKDKTANISFEMKTLFAQEMAESNILMDYLAISYSHTSKELEMTLEAAQKALRSYAQALDSDVHKYLKSRVVKPVFRKFN